MKKLFLFLTLLFSVMSFATNEVKETTKAVTEVVDVVEPTVSEAERLIDKYSGKAGEMVKELAEALKVPAEHVYGIFVRQAVVDSIIFLIILLIGIGLLYGAFSRWSNGSKEDIKQANYTNGSNSSDWEGMETFVQITSIIMLIFGFVITLIGLLNVDVIVQGFINPEYSAIKEIFGLLN